MCGIAGIIFPNAVEQCKHQVHNMVNSLKHRGPDNQTVHSFKNAVFGHTRLSIVDLLSGNQPMLSDDNSRAVVFNGEIYGYQDIKGKITYNYKTTSDTELLLALYSHYQGNMLQHLPGVFSFAIWDNKSQSLFCARDRFGEKPFYYARGKNDEFIFASEIKAILATGLVEPTINPTAFGHYIERFYVKPNETIYNNIFSLPPAHSLSFCNGTLKIENYWQIPEQNNAIKPYEAKEQFRHLFNQSVKKQLIADVPVVAFLSGGLDSTSVVTAAKEFNPNLKVLSFQFDEENDETPIARATARKLGLDIECIKLASFNPAEMLWKMVDVYDEPFADSSNIPTYLISKQAVSHAKVCLTGDGGDELLGGYEHWYKPLLYFSKANNSYIQKETVFTWAKIFWKLGLKSKATQYFNLYDAICRYKDQPSIIEAHYLQTAFFKPEEIRELYKVKSKIQEYLTRFSPTNDVSDAMRMDVLDFMPGDILVKTDRASMANSLELRAPFLDVDLAEFCLTLPAKFKIDKNSSKLLLRETFGSEWNRSVIKAPKKGFEIPLQKWMTSKEMVELVNQYLMDSKLKIFNYLNFPCTKELVKSNPTRTFGLLSLSLWMEKNTYL